MRTVRFAVALAVLVGLSVAPSGAAPLSQWSFDGADRIELEGVSGDISVQAGSGAQISIEVAEDVSPSNAFRAEVERDGSTIRVREDWVRRGSGSVEWTLVLPESVVVSIVAKTASGDLVADEVEAFFDFSTASGDVRLSGVSIADGSSFTTASGDLVLSDVNVGDDVEMSTASGDVDFRGVSAGSDFAASTASGDVDVESSTGVTRASSASGDVRVSQDRLFGPSAFSSASGDVSVSLGAAPGHELVVSSASGDAALEAPFGDDFTLILTKRRDRGGIDSPFEPTSERQFERDGRTYVEQTVVRGSGRPEVRVSTAAGSIEVRNR
jgi:DUF4097 and DUF4098 domain-containing protein YvlB